MLASLEQKVQMFLFCLLSAVELECELVFELNGALQTVYILRKLILCNGMPC